MRGARRDRASLSTVAGIIPAYAGSTLPGIAAAAGIKDHPRVCGEHNNPTILTISSVGSSPRMRGAPLDDDRHMVFERDHPRVCGEHYMIEEMAACREGSSPRMRGAPTSVNADSR